MPMYCPIYQSIILLLILTACSGLGPATTTDTQSATPTLTVTIAQQLAIIQPSSIPTARPRPTERPLPTDTPFPTNMPISVATSLPQGYINTSLLNLRSGPALDSNILGTIAQNRRVDVVERSNDGEWLRICCPLDGTTTAWVSADFVVVDSLVLDVPRLSDTSDTDGATVAELVDEIVTGRYSDAGDTVTGVVNAAAVNVRGGPGINYAVVGQVSQGSTLEITGRVENISWWRVCCPVEDRAESWISASLVDLRVPVGSSVEAITIAPVPPTPEVAAVIAPAGATGGGNQAAAVAAAPAPGLPGNGGFGAPGGTNPLTGRPFVSGNGGQRPIIVVINNDFAARPQLGMSQADIMYEYLMEGYGITRFSGIYYGESVGQIGPVRSARLINYYMGALYNAGVVASGASDGVRFAMREQAPFPYLDIDLDDPSNTRYTVSIGTDYRTRLRTSTAGLRAWLANNGLEQPASVRGFTFAGAAGGGVPATSINIPYPGGVVFTYNGNRYLRSMGGTPHIDGNTGGQIAVENLVVQYVPHEVTDIVEDSLGSLSIRLNLFGSGRSIVFRDGQGYEGTWRSESRGDIPRFFKQDGGEIALKPGKTWIAVVPFSYSIGY